MNDDFVIYLDIDGVLCPYDDFITDLDGEHQFRDYAVAALNEIISYYNARLVMVSGWNSKFGSTDEYRKFLESRGVKVSSLEVGDQLDRLIYILNHKRVHGIERYLIIDDEAHKYYKRMVKMADIEYKRILQPNRYRCLDHHDAKMVIHNFKL